MPVVGAGSGVGGRRLVLGRRRDGCVGRFERAHQGRQRTVAPFSGPGHRPDPGRASRSPHAGSPEPAGTLTA